MSSSFSHAVRIVTCASCGAPLEVDVSGGDTRCSYCGAINHVGPRDEAADRARARESSRLSEMERLARLREQADRADGLPSGLQDLVDLDGRLRLERAEHAKARWLEARVELSDGGSFAVEERLFALTLLLVPRGHASQRRAVLETAIELLSDEGHRHVMRCLIARYAAAAGELDAAEEWLALCLPKPLELRMDTAYRLASATIAMMRGEPKSVLALVAEGTPLAQELRLEVDLLRLWALHALGRQGEALAAREQMTSHFTADTVLEALPSADPTGLAAEAYVTFLREAKQAEIEELERQLRTGDFPKRDPNAPNSRRGGGCLDLLFSVSVFGPGVTWFFLVFGSCNTEENYYRPGALTYESPWVWLATGIAALVLTLLLMFVTLMLMRRSQAVEVRASLASSRNELARLSGALR